MNEIKKNFLKFMKECKKKGTKECVKKIIDRTKNLVHKQWLLILILVLVIPIPYSINFLLGDIGGNGTNDGWLGFWGGYLGSIIAILGVYLQVNSEIRNTKEQIKIESQRYLLERDLQYKSYTAQLHVFVGKQTVNKVGIMTIDKDQDLKNNKLLEKLTDKRTEEANKKLNVSEYMEVVNITNWSDNSLFELIVTICYKDKSEDKFKNTALLKGKSIIFYSNKLVSKSIEFISIFAITSVGEKIFYEFKEAKIDDFVLKDILYEHSSKNLSNKYDFISGQEHIYPLTIIEKK